jgi:hypothetical protein
MNKQEFESLYLGNFKPDQRYIDLYERLSLYYKQTPDQMDNRTAMGYWREFKRWCAERGYTQEEINRAKRNVRI